MTIQEIVQEIVNNGKEYFTESIEPIVVGTEPARKHRNRRIQKKWLKRFGVKPKIAYKKCKKLDVTTDMIIDFCHKNNMPLPIEILTASRGKTENEI